MDGTVAALRIKRRRKTHHLFLLLSDFVSSSSTNDFSDATATITVTSATSASASIEHNVAATTIAAESIPSSTNEG